MEAQVIYVNVDARMYHILKINITKDHLCLI